MMKKVLFLGMIVAMSWCLPAAEGPAHAPAPGPTSRAGSAFMPCAVAFFGAKLLPGEMKGFDAAVDGLQLRLTRVDDHFEMEPLGLAQPKPADFKAPLVTVRATDVTYDAGPMIVLWKMDQLFNLPTDWTAVETIAGKGAMGEAILGIERREGKVLVQCRATGSRPETWTFTPF